MAFVILRGLLLVLLDRFNIPATVHEFLLLERSRMRGSSDADVVVAPAFLLICVVVIKQESEWQ